MKVTAFYILKAISYICDSSNELDNRFVPLNIIKQWNFFPVTEIHLQ